MTWWTTSCNLKGRKRRKGRNSAKDRRKILMKIRVNLSRGRIRHKVNRIPSRCQLKRQQQRQVTLQWRKVEADSSLLEGIRIGLRLRNPGRRRHLLPLEVVVAMRRLNRSQCNVSSKSKGRHQQLTVQMLKVKRRFLRLLQMSNSRLKWWPSLSNSKSTAKSRWAFMHASSGLTMKNNGSWSWSCACKCWKTEHRSIIHLLHLLLLQRQPLLQLAVRAESTIDALQPQD